MHHYPRHIGDYLTATAHLSLLEHGVYTRLLDVYYTRETPIPDDQAERLVGARTQEERDAVRLVLAEFFKLGGDGWRQSRCDEEIEACREKQAKAAKSADARWSKQREERSECERNANAMRTHSEGNAPNTNTNIPTSLRSAGKARATRLPLDWRPPDDDWGWAIAEIGEDRAKGELAKFADWWAAKAGAGGTKLDWPATWRNWIRKASEYAQSRGNGSGSSGGNGGRKSAVDRVREANREALEGDGDSLAEDDRGLRAPLDERPRRDTDGFVVDGAFRVVG